MTEAPKNVLAARYVMDLAERLEDERAARGRYERTLEAIATPNRGAKPTGDDAVRMAAAAREVLDEVKERPEVTDPEVERLRRIEKAARVYFREFDHLLFSDYPERRDLREALDA